MISTKTDFLICFIFHSLTLSYKVENITVRINYRFSHLKMKIRWLPFGIHNFQTLTIYPCADLGGGVRTPPPRNLQCLISPILLEMKKISYFSYLCTSTAIRQGWTPPGKFFWIRAWCLPSFPLEYWHGLGFYFVYFVVYPVEISYPVY